MKVFLSKLNTKDKLAEYNVDALDIATDLYTIRIRRGGILIFGNKDKINIYDNNLDLSMKD